MTNKEPKTPIYKVLFCIGVSLFFVFTVLFFVIYHRGNELAREIENIESFGSPTFSVIKDHHIKIKNRKRQDIYTYNIPDEKGDMHEVSEPVDEKTHNRLRVGDTVICLRKIIILSGKKIVLSRIKGNTESPQDFTFLKTFSIFGLIFSTIILMFAIFFGLKKIFVQ